MAFNHKTFSRNICICLKLINIGRQQNHIKQLVEILTSLCRNRHHNRITTPFFWIEIKLSRKLRLGQLNIRAFLINLVNRNNNLRICRLSKLNCFRRLWLYAIIRRNDNYDNIRKHCTVLTNRRKGLVARRIKKSNLALFVFHLVGRNMLRNTTSLALDSLFL